MRGCSTSGVVCLCIVLLLAASAGAVDLTSGKTLKLSDRDGTARDMAKVRFVKDVNITAPLPDPTTAPSWMRLHSEDGDTGAIALETSLWEPRGPSGYKYIDVRPTPGAVAKIILRTRGVDGKLIAILRRDAYGAVALQGPENFVEVELGIGTTTYCGRFESPPSVVKKNEPGKVVLKGPSIPCVPATPTGTATPTHTATSTPTNTPTVTPTDTPTHTPTHTPTWTPTNTPTATPTETPTSTPTPTPPLFQFALFGDEWVLLDINTYSDSYDSELGSYCDFAMPLPRLADCNAGMNYCGNRMMEGDVGTNGTTDSVLLVSSNTTVFGDAQVGPGANVGALLNDGTIYGATAELTEPKVLTPIDAPYPGPAATAMVAVDILCNNCVAALVLAPGDYIFPYIEIAGNNMTYTIQISGDTTLFMDRLQAGGSAELHIDAGASNAHVKLVMDDFLMLSNGEFNFTGTGDSEITFYVNDSFDMDSNFGMNNDTQDATRMSIIGTSTMTNTLDFSSNTKYFGTIYAPEADVLIYSHVELYGAAIGKTITLDPLACVHYEEKLGRDGP